MKLMEIRAQNPGKHRVIWHDLEAEATCAGKALPEAVSVYGARDLDTRGAHRRLLRGCVAEMISQARDARGGCNFPAPLRRGPPPFRASDASSMTSSKPSTGVYRFLQRDRVTIHHLHRSATRDPPAVEKDGHKELVAMTSHRPRTDSCQRFAAIEAPVRQSGAGALRGGSKERMGYINNDRLTRRARCPTTAQAYQSMSIPFSTQYK